jgi:hypothetical protein
VTDDREVPAPYLHDAFLHVRLWLDDGPMLPSAAFPDRRVKVVRLEYEVNMETGVTELYAYGRPTGGRRGTARTDAVTSDETLARIDDDTRSVWEQDVRTIVATLRGIADETGET